VSKSAYNKAFFGLYESIYETMREDKGEFEALGFLKKLFSKALGKAYDEMGFQKGSYRDFCRVVAERDDGVGIEVDFPESSDRKIVYRFHTDPFPNLKGKVDPRLLADTYIRFKVEYLLGSNWTYETTRHIWEGSPFTEHVITHQELQR
jgi:hypothetical protein